MVEPESRQVVSDLHQSYKAMYEAAPIEGYALKSYTDWMHQLERMLYNHGKRLLNVGIRIFGRVVLPASPAFAGEEGSQVTSLAARKPPGVHGRISGTPGASPVLSPPRKHRPGSTAQAAQKADAGSSSLSPPVNGPAAVTRHRVHGDVLGGGDVSDLHRHHAIHGRDHLVVGCDEGERGHATVRSRGLTLSPPRRVPCDKIDASKRLSRVHDCGTFVVRPQPTNELLGSG